LNIQLGLGKKYRSTRLRLDAVELIMAYKEVYSYEELQGKLAISASILCRYYQGLAIPSESTARKVLGTLLSKDNVKEYLYKLINKYGGSVARIFSNPRTLNLLSLYIVSRIVSNLAGSGLRGLLTLPGFSSLITSLVASKLGLPVSLIPTSTVREHTDIYEELTLRRGDYIVAIYDTLTSEALSTLLKFIRERELTLKMLEAVILIDKNVEEGIRGITTLEYLIP